MKTNGRNLIQIGTQAAMQHRGADLRPGIDPTWLHTIQAQPTL